MSVLTDNTAKLRKILEKVENLPEMPPGVAQATPTISVSSGGLITATATQEAGAVAAGTKSATRQLTTKGGTTITPGTSEQTAVSAGTYVTGDIKVAASTGKQVATGTVTLSGSKNTITISPGFTPKTIYMFVNGSSVYDISVCCYQNNKGTAYRLEMEFDATYPTKRATNVTLTVNGGEVSLKMNSAGLYFVTGTWNWMAAD